MNLARKILSDPVNKWIFSYANEHIFLVGGYIRDLLRGVYINKDRDYVIKGNIREIAIRASRKFKGTFVELKKDQMIRVVLKDGQFMDCSQMQNTILEDLGKRDFRINAIAWSPENGFFDPFDGMTDIKSKIIRIINPVNLAKDPLRVIRAYRLAAQLRFTIDMDTRNYLRKYSPDIKNTAPERITEELSKIIITDHPSHYISMCEKDKVLQQILNASTARIRTNIEVLKKFDRYIIGLRSGKFKKLFNSRILPVLDLNIGQGLNGVGLMRLSILLNNLHRTGEDKYGRLRFSNSIMKKVMKIQKGISLGTGRITNNKLYDIFKGSDDCAFEVALLVSVTRPKNVDKFLKRADNFIKSKKKPLLDGYEIQKILNIDPSAQVGLIQAEIQKRRFLGITRTKGEARHWILSNFT